MTIQPKPVIKEMGRPQLFPYIGLSPLVTVLGLGFALMVGFTYQPLVGIMAAVAIVLAGRWMNNTDPKFVELLILSLKTRGDFNPALMEDSHERADVS